MPRPRHTVPASSREVWAAQIAQLQKPANTVTPQREPLTQQRIVEAALRVIQEEGLEALTMRRLATALEVSAGALYLHVRDRAALDQLLIGALCARITLPVPDPPHWRTQVLDVCRQLSGQYLAHPGIAQAAFATAPLSLESQRIYEGLLDLLLAGGLTPVRAAWVIDALVLYIGAHSLVAGRREADVGLQGQTAGRREFSARLQMLPADRFPHSVAHADAVTSGTAAERFDFAIHQLLGVDHEGRL